MLKPVHFAKYTLEKNTLAKYIFGTTRCGQLHIFGKIHFGNQSVKAVSENILHLDPACKKW